jgi:hypothetical protein
MTGQEPGTSDEYDCSRSVSYGRTLTWHDSVQSTRTLTWLSKAESCHLDNDLNDDMDNDMDNDVDNDVDNGQTLNDDLHPVRTLPITTALSPVPSTTSVAKVPNSQNQSLAMCDNVSQLSDYSDAPKVKQDIGLAASGTIGQCFLNGYNRAVTWINILQLKRPQPLHTINAIQQLSSQAEVVLQMLFSVGCLPGKTGQTTHMSQDGSETDLFSTS